MTFVIKLQKFLIDFNEHARFLENMKRVYLCNDSGKIRGAVEINNEEPGMEDNIDPVITKSASKGTTTAHFVKFINDLLDIMDLDENMKGSYIVMDNASIHKSKPMIRKIESKGYRIIYLPLYSPELNPIEQFWAIVKGKMKRHRLMYSRYRYIIKEILLLKDR
jgi:hypothetical protein